MSSNREEMKRLGFDADLSPGHPINQAAATANNLRFDEQREAYINADGSLILDKFGQPY